GDNASCAAEATGAGDSDTFAGGYTSNRMDRGGAMLLEPYRQPAAPASVARRMAATTGHKRGDRGTGAATVRAVPAIDTPRNVRLRSPAFCQRSSGSFLRHCSTMWSSAGGESGWRDETIGGASFKIAPMTLAADSPSNGRVPVAIS